MLALLGYYLLLHGLEIVAYLAIGVGVGVGCAVLGSLVHDTLAGKGERV